MAQQSSLDSDDEIVQWLVSKGLQDIKDMLTGMTLDRLLDLSNGDTRTICVVLGLNSQQIERLIHAVNQENSQSESVNIKKQYYLTIYQQLITMGFDDDISLEASKNCNNIEQSIEYISKLNENDYEDEHKKPDQALNVQNCPDELKMDEQNSKKTESMLTCTPDEVITPQFPTKPKKDCRAFFTGLVVSDKFMNYHTSIVYKIDEFSEYVGAGSYPKNCQAFPKAVATTFDGIAIDRNTRVIIWEKENFQGKILLDQVGPSIINNVKWKNQGATFPQYVEAMTKTFDDPELQKNFPQHVRYWSISDMHAWSHGSVKVVGAD